MPEPLEILKQYFGYPAFRPLQEDIIKSSLNGKDTLALLPTGGGKSVCYQVPALCMHGICIVITPLIALMKDQVMQLRKRNVSALVIHSGMAFYEVRKALQNATTGQFKFLYLSPERLQTRLFLEYLPAMPVNLIAVDEAHCISQWGYDFRPPYLRIADLREEMPEVPVIALTASATPEVQRDICEKLNMASPAIFTQSFARPNLSFSAFDTPHKMNKLLEILKSVPGCSLVYCRNRKRTKEISQWLCQQGIAASYYHAGLSTEDRSLRQEEWLRNQTRIMVCTNAFGMGIDKPDVRVVVHVDLPDCPENYYQEAGRGGRDGKRSYAVLLYTQDDLRDLEKLPEKKFPTLDVIRQVYQQVANYLQLPTGSGEGEYFDFDLSLFAERYKMDPVITVNVLNTLAQAGYLTFNESVFVPSKAGFCTSKNYLHQFESEQPKLEPLIKALLRTYEGIFDNEVNISERMIARLLNIEKEEVKRQLQSLVFYQILQYSPVKDTPQLYFNYNRISAGQVTIDQQSYLARRRQYEHRIREMIRYAYGRSCRSMILQKYFGETEVQPCEICDFCLAKKRTVKIQHSQLLSWLNVAAKILMHQPLGADDLRKKLGITKYECDQMIELGLREEILEYNDSLQFYVKGI